MKTHLHKISCFLLLTLLIWSASTLKDLRTEYSVDQFYPTEHGLLKHHKEITHQFRLSQESPYLYVIHMNEPDAWLKPPHVKKLQGLTSLIQDMSHVKQVLSITHVEGASQSDEALVIGNIFDRVKPPKWRKAVLENALLYPLLITKDFQSTLLVVEPNVQDKLKLEASEKEIFQLIQTHFPEAQVSSAGVPLLQTRLSDMIQSELSVFLILTSLAFCLIFYLIFSHWSAILCSFISVMGANIFALGLMSSFKIPMNAILVTLPVIVSVSVMSLLIHTLHLWSQRLRPGNRIAVWNNTLETLKEIWLPNALGIITTALGFLALAPSPIPLISQYGFIVALILGFVAIFNQLMMMVLLPYVKPTMRKWFNRPASWALWSVHHPQRILYSLLVVFVCGGVMVSHLNFSPRLFDDLPETDTVRTTTEWIDKAFGGILTYEVSAISNQVGFWRTPEALKRLKGLAKTLRTSTGIGTVVTVSDFFQDDKSPSKGQIAETFFLFSMAEKNPLNSFMTEDSKTMRLSIRLRDLPAQELEKTKTWIRESYLKSFPELSFREGGMANYAHAINQEVAKALIFDFWQPLLLISIFLIFMFRSLKWAILSSLPNFIPPAVLIAALAITQVPVKPGVALIFSIALGFAFNNTLYLLCRLKSLMKEGESEPLKKALLMEANPCLFESLIMFIGFSIFLFSEFNMNQTFGGFMLISIMAGFVADLVCLPAFLKVFPQVYQVNLRPKKSVLVTAALSFTLFLSQSSPLYAAPLEAKDILKKSQSLLDAKDDEAQVEMKIIEENGEAKSRTLNLQTLREKGFSVLARIESPADIKDMAFLGNVDPEGNEMQWIYLPSSGQVRRLVTGKTKAGLLGSEISPEDLNSEAIKSSSVKLLKTDEKYYWIELIPNKDASEYSKVVMKISKDDFLPKFTAYYVQSGLKKTVAFKDYKKIGPVWRAHGLMVQNHLNKRSTEVKLSNVKVNRGLASSNFSQSNLKEN